MLGVVGCMHKYRIVMGESAGRKCLCLDLGTNILVGLFIVHQYSN